MLHSAFIIMVTLLLITAFDWRQIKSKASKATKRDRRTYISITIAFGTLAVAQQVFGKLMPKVIPILYTILKPILSLMYKPPG
ncbi:hypothetical protein [Paenibacillus sp. 481]|uniref:hypothetical protein n=1 Tax=Paenibacillus sp. 481 TaxID=2835869 RepID=UPI001E3CB1DA|nr:hypothetical protein [Paenibacillus sp. 481]UHA75601.1 hypothetical protein KIK04_11770 [Paenibacillus sp. 481]